MIVRIISHSRPAKTKIEQDICYYDYDQKKIVNCKGGRLQLTYDYKKRKLVPTIEDMESMVSTNSWDDAIKWVKAGKYEVLEINSPRTIDFRIDEYKWRKAQRELDSLRVHYDVLDESDEEEN